MRKSEDVVKVGDRKQLGFPRLDPSRFRESLAFGAMAVATGIVGAPLKTTAITLIEMAAEIRCAAYLDIMHDFQVGGGQRVIGAIPFTVVAEDVSHFIFGPLPHRFLERIEGIGHDQTPCRSFAPAGISRRSRGLWVDESLLVVSWR